MSRSFTTRWCSNFSCAERSRSLKEEGSEGGRKGAREGGRVGERESGGVVVVVVVVEGVKWKRGGREG